MKVHVLGGGPAGLYLAILLKRADPRHAITVVERDGRDDTFGWGIVFSDRTLAFLKDQDAPTYEAISGASETWDNVDTVLHGETVSVRGNGFSGIARLAFLRILRQRAAELGVDLRFHEPVTNVTPWLDCDLLVGADGASSLLRTTYAGFFQPSLDTRQNRYIWLGTPHRFAALSMIFRRAEAGLFIAHAYRFGPETSTFIVECPPETWTRSGLEDMTGVETSEYLAEVFREELDGAPLLSNNFVRWLNFPLVKNRHWHHRHLVLLGDAAHTAHFSIGSGTKLALEDAIALARTLSQHPFVATALPAYAAARKPKVDAFQEAAYASLTWLEHVDRHLDLPAVPFTYRLMTRSRRIGYAQIKARDPDFIGAYDAWRAEQPASGPIPAEFLDLFEKPSLGHLATLMPDGTPHVTPVWVDYDGDCLLVNSAAGRQKDLNMTARHAVAVEIVDPDNPNRYLHVRGPVIDVTEDGADAHLDHLAARYLGRPTYPESWRFPGEVRRIYRIRPRRVTTWAPFG